MDYLIKNKNMYTKEQFKEIFKAKFDINFWKNTFLNSFFGAIDIRTEETGELIESPSVTETGYYLGKQQTEDALLGFFYYKINAGSVVHRRVGLRNLVKQFINPRWGIFDAALVVFDDGENWRLSLVCDIKNEAMAAKRFTFVFGESEQTYHTAVERFLKLQSDGILFKTLKEAFSVETLTKEFYTELSNWYFWALQNVDFPNSFEQNKEINNSTAVIRLITRLMFVWFLKKKISVINKLFDKTELDNILNYNDKTESTFYKAILQNLFFATLNTEMGEKRKFVNRQSGIQGFYRYERFFKNKERFLDLTKNIPFLNGGLFENLDKNVGVENETRIDCFSNRMDKEQLLKVPDFLFFGEEKTVDLNKIYDTISKTYKVRGLINILNAYNFTIEENTPADIEVALDPELLGKVFENLLASFNPETQTTARKQTGSFYTPREIVDYMVRESLIAYLKNYFLNEKSGYLQIGNNQIEIFGNENRSQLVLEQNVNQWIGKENELENNLKKLFESNSENPFDKENTKNLIFALDNCKIIDPACGSGAFPMGILQKMVQILQKLDPKNKLWKQRQLDIASKIEDTQAREMAIANIEEAFENNELDYGRKLFLIENCIFGIDIQPIAVQIAKLRFFISLICEQTLNNQKQNLGIRPLPNLETKFVAANTLIGLDKPKQANLFRTQEIIDKENELKGVRHKHFSARTPETKAKYREKDQQLRYEIANILTSLGYAEDTAQKLALWNPYDQNATSPFFDAEWMFGLTKENDHLNATSEGGFFDVVIGNPPWITYTHKLLGDNLVNYYKSKYFCAEGFKLNSFPMFVEESMSICKKNGIFSLIVPNRLLDTPSYKGTRKKIIERDLLLLESLPAGGFESVVAANIIISVANRATKKNDIISRNFYTRKELVIPYSSIIQHPELQFNINRNPAATQIINKINSGKNCILSDLCFIHVGMMVRNRNSVFSKSEGIDKIVEGEDIDKYVAKQFKTFNLKEIDIFGGTKKESKHRSSPKLFVRKTGKIILSSIDESGIFAEQSVYLVIPKEIKFDVKYLCALLNSKLLTYYFQNELITNPEAYPYIQHYDLEKIPIILTPNQDSIITLVEKILSAKQENPQTNTTELEKEIDKKVYELYGLTEDEIKIIEHN